MSFSMKHLKRCHIIILVACIVVVSFISYHYIKEYQHQQAQVAQRSEFIKEHPSSSKETTISESSIHLPEKGELLGILTIGRIAFTQNVYQGDDESILDQGIGHYMKSALPGYGNVILLAGHNGTHFKGLEDAKRSDEVTLQTSYGTYHYRIDKTVIMEADEFQEADLTSDQETLVMYTCYPFDSLDTTQRYFVYGTLETGPTIIR